MSRGTQAAIGTRSVNQNGYTSVKTAQGWRFLHHVLAEEILGRPLRPGERVRFRDGNRKNLAKSNILVVEGTGTRAHAVRSSTGGRYDELEERVHTLEKAFNVLCKKAGYNPDEIFAIASE